MNISTLANAISVHLSPSSRRDAKRNKPLSYQSLEQRKLLATFTVTTLLDSADGATDGEISLREAIIAADTNAAFGDAPAGELLGDTIRFDPSLTGQEITLSNGELQISQRLNIVGDSTDVSVIADQESRVFNIESSEEVRISGITIRGGIHDGSVNGGGIQIRGGGLLRLSQVVFISHGDLFAFQNVGGAIYNQGSEIISVGSRFTDNVAGFGGAIYSEAGRLYLQNNTFESNFASSSGGAIFIEGGNHFFDGGSFSENSARDPALITGGTGGAINVGDGAELTVRDATFSKNLSSFGAAIRVGPDTTLRVNSVFTANDADGIPNGSGITTGRGGAIANLGELVVFGGRFEGNEATEGGGIYNLQGTAVVNNAQFLGNRALEFGGAIAVEDSVARILNTTIGGFGEGEGNSAINSFPTNSTLPSGRGGAIALEGTSNVTVEGGSIINNSSLFRGGAINVAEGSRIQFSEGTEIADNTVGFEDISNEFGTYPLGLGGGIFSTGTVLIDDAVIARNLSDGSGGGVYVADGYTRVENSTIIGNRADVAGGGLAVAGGTALVRNTAVGGTDRASGNFAGVPGSENPNGTGGGISVSDDAIRFRVDGGIITGNAATLSGGGIHASAGIVSLVNGVQVTNNRALLTDGGGVYTDGVTSFAAIDAVFEGNTARDGAGLFNNSGRLFLSGSLVNNNEARRVAGGLYTRDFVGIGDTDISGNTARTDADFFQEV